MDLTFPDGLAFKAFYDGDYFPERGSASVEAFYGLAKGIYFFGGGDWVPSSLLLVFKGVHSETVQTDQYTL